MMALDKMRYSMCGHKNVCKDVRIAGRGRERASDESSFSGGELLFRLRIAGN